ncbi:hypothetical protein [Blautia sp. XA-2221]|uniref:hypothetical protein n=1 Tax=Blautia sp. XA-2221 TaxID=2903961 RepID=UPI0023784779|nr:hypothetical protein [Blautia sp. XA-2221]
MFGEIQPAVKKETKKVILYTLAGVVLMWVVFAVLHGAIPEKIPFDYTVILGGLGGGAVAVLNFFLMGLTVQKAASCEDEGAARMRLKASYSQRMLLQVGWGIAAIIAPCFQFAAGLLPLLFPSMGIKLNAIFKKK